MRKKKILRVITRLERGGVPYELLYISKNQQINKIYDQVIATGYTKDEIPIPQDVRLIRIKNLVREISPLRDILSLLELIVVINKQKPDILHLHTSKAGLLGRIAGKLCKVPHIIYSPHGHVFYGYFSKPKVLLISLLEYLASFITDVIVVRTQEEKEAFESIGCKSHFFEIPKAPINYKALLTEKTYDQSIEGEQGRNKENEHQGRNKENEYKVIATILAKKNKGNFIVGTIARLEPVKGIEYFVKAFPFIKDKVKNVFFVVAGDGSQRAYLQKIGEESVSSDSFIFTGWIENPEEIYKTFDVFVVPSLNEAWGITILEAGKFGIPIIASSVGGIPFFAGGYVKLIPPKNPQALAQAVVEVLSSPKLRKILSMRAKELYEKYSEETMIRRYIELYDFISKIKK